MLHAPNAASSFFSRLHSSSRSVSYDGSTTEEAEPVDIRRAHSLKVPGRVIESRRDAAGLASFSAAGSALTSPPTSERNFTPPAASRHALFSHHAAPLNASPSIMSDSGPSSPPSPTSSIASGAFSPASNFLSHFSSQNSLKPPQAPDGQGALVLDYTLGRILGRGGFSTVRLATHIVTGETLACKIVKRDDLSDRSGSVEKFEEEIRIWKSLPKHPSLLPLLDMHRRQGMTFLLIPFMPGGSLLDVLRREGDSEKTASKWFPGVVAAVAAMHRGYAEFSGGLLHGDLKLDNFLVDNAGRVMVCDFYMAQMVNNALPTIPHPRRSPHRHDPLPLPSASLPYAPPELLRAPPSGPSLAQDIWALGIILHALLTGRLPFVDSFDPRLQMKILRGTWEEPHYLSKQWLECLRGCLDGNRSTRWDIETVRRCDAVTGWREVITRSRSRSRRRD